MSLQEFDDESHMQRTFELAREADPPAELLADAQAHDLYFLGDWVEDVPRLHGALRNGLDAGERLAELN